MSDPNTHTAGEIVYNDSPNVQVADDQGILRRATLVAAAEGDIVYPDNERSTNVQVMGSDGNLHRAQLVAMIGGGGGGQAEVGRFLAPWNCATGLPTTNPPESPYTYKTGDYYVVDTVAASGGTNYRPDGDSYTINVASTTVESAAVAIKDIYLYDGTTWSLLKTSSAVTSVNGQTGDINIKSINGNSLMGTGDLELTQFLNYPNSWPVTSSSTTKDFCDAVAADSTAVAGKMYLGEVRWSDLPGNMVNGEVAVEIMSGTTSSNKVIVLTLTSGNVSPYRWQYTYWNGGSNVSGWVTFGDKLPSQTGNSGKFLTTNGTSASWATVDALPAQTGHNGEVLTTNGSAASWTTPTTITFRTWGANE